MGIQVKDFHRIPPSNLCVFKREVEKNFSYSKSYILKYLQIILGNAWYLLDNNQEEEGRDRV